MRRCTRTLYCRQRGASRLCRWGQQRRARDCSRPPRCLGGRGPGHQLACARRLRRSGRLALVLRHPQLPPTLDRDGSPQSQPRVPVKGRWGAAAGAEPPETRRWEAQRAPRARSGRRGGEPKRGSAPRRCRGRGTVPGPGPTRGLGRRAAPQRASAGTFHGTSPAYGKCTQTCRGSCNCPAQGGCPRNGRRPGSQTGVKRVTRAQSPRSAWSRIWHERRGVFEERWRESRVPATLIWAPRPLGAGGLGPSRRAYDL